VHSNDMGKCRGGGIIERRPKRFSEEEEVIQNYQMRVRLVVIKGKTLFLIIERGGKRSRGEQRVIRNSRVHTGKYRFFLKHPGERKKGHDRLDGDRGKKKILYYYSGPFGERAVWLEVVRGQLTRSTRGAGKSRWKYRQSIYSQRKVGERKRDTKVGWSREKINNGTKEGRKEMGVNYF